MWLHYGIFPEWYIFQNKKSQETIMTGLRCGTPAMLAWEILKDESMFSFPSLILTALKPCMISITRSKLTSRYLPANLCSRSCRTYRNVLWSCTSGIKKRDRFERGIPCTRFCNWSVTDSEVFEELILRETDTKLKWFISGQSRFN